jgi:hypothetical protein
MSAGGPGAGKSHVFRYLVTHGALPDFGKDIALIDLDRNRQFTQAWRHDKAKIKSQKTVNASQVQAGFISDLLAATCCLQSKSFIFDGTMRNSEIALKSMMRWKGLAEPRRVQICILFVDTDIDICKTRVKKRTEEEGRPVPEKYVEDTNQQSRASFDRLKDNAIVDLCIRIENNGDEPVISPEDMTRLTQFVQGSSQALVGQMAGPGASSSSSSGVNPPDSGSTLSASALAPEVLVVRQPGFQQNVSELAGIVPGSVPDAHIRPPSFDFVGDCVA